jgi:hypothetical protein
MSKVAARCRFVPESFNMRGPPVTFVLDSSQKSPEHTRNIH